MGATIKVTVVREKDEESKESSEKRADLPRSGSAYTDDQLMEMCEGVSDAIDRKDPFDDMFVSAFIAGMQFGCVKEGAETHGMTVEEFARNSYGWCLQHVAMLDMRRELASLFGE